jgi:formylglycine-generating enzyme required for sulfatase activity
VRALPAGTQIGYPGRVRSPGRHRAGVGSWVVFGAVVAAMSSGTGCRGRNLASGLAGTPTIEDQARCGVMKSSARPLIIEWPSSDRGALEGLVERGSGLVAVRYEGCEMELVRRCEVVGRYGYTPVEPKRDDQVFRSADELYAKIPLGAAQLEAELARHGALALEMTVVGHYDAARERVRRSELRGDCERATHVITTVTVGAFKLSSEAGAEVSAGGRFAGAGGGVSSSAERGFERSDGDPSRCSSDSDSTPPERCGSLLRLEVEPIREAEEIAAQRERRPCPRGSALVEGGRYRPAVGTQGEVEVRDFCLDQAEVSVAEYADCAGDGPCSDAATSAQAEGMTPAQRTAESELCNGDRRLRGRHPVNCVTWHQAEAYCRARGGRLPSEQEWEWAARGGDQERTYPWGEEEPGPRLVNACGRECARHFEERHSEPWPSLFEASDGAIGTAKVGEHPRGAGRGRVHDLAGNVWEWTSSPEMTYREEAEQHAGGGEGRGGPDTGNRVVRGGSFMAEESEALKASARELRSVKDRRPDLGFRCARDP